MPTPIKRPAPRVVLPALAGLLALAAGSRALFAQASPPAAPAAPTEVTQTAAAVDKAIADLGESPIAAILEAAGPEAREFNDHVTTLANPFFEGRVPGVRGNGLAGDYIEWYFEHAGLRPAFKSDVPAADGSTVVDPNSSYRQHFEAGTALKVATQMVSFDLGGRGQLILTPDKDFTVLGTSGNGKASGHPVFVGYSIANYEDEHYDSFPFKTDLTGKIAVLFRFEPMDADGRSKWTKGGWSPASALDAKVKAASDHGAAGIIVVNPPGVDDPRGNSLVALESSRGKALTVPVVMVSAPLAEKLLGMSLWTLRTEADDKAFIKDFPDASVTIETGLTRDPITTSNIGGVIPGRGALKDQYIILGAHYDHVGYGPLGVDAANVGKLHPGADDNASGTSAVLVLAGKLAKAYAELPSGANARSILLLAFSSEESGLIGSHYFVAHPSIGAEQMSLMINMDMVGRLRTDPPLDVEGTESAEGFYDWLAPHFEKSGIKITHGSNVAQNSDHYSFYNHKVPVLFFFTGYHKDYHKPGDFAWKTNPIGAARIIALVHDITLAAAQRAEPFAFREPPKKEEDHAAAVGSVHGTRVRFGIAPGNYGDDNGVLVGDVSDHTSASEAGIKAGDRMVKWNGKAIEGVEAWMPMLSEAKPGDVVDVTVLRDGKEQVIKVTLKAATQSGR